MTNPSQALEEDFGVGRKITTAQSFNNYLNRKLADEEEEEELVDKKLKLSFFDNPSPPTW